MEKKFTSILNFRKKVSKMDSEKKIYWKAFVKENKSKTKHFGQKAAENEDSCSERKQNWFFYSIKF